MPFVVKKVLCWHGGRARPYVVDQFGGGLLNNLELLGPLGHCKAYHWPRMQVRSGWPAAVASILKSFTMSKIQSFTLPFLHFYPIMTKRDLKAFALLINFLIQVNNVIERQSHKFICESKKNLGRSYAVLLFHSTNFQASEWSSI